MHAHDDRDEVGLPGAKREKMAITNKDIDKLKEVFATKEDLNRFATKEDLKGFATNENLKSFRNEIITRLDKIVGELEKAREDRVFAKAKDDEQDRRLDGVELRMKKVEAKVA